MRSLVEPATSSFEILTPAQWSVPMVFNSPHSGNQLPEAFVTASRLDATQLRTSEDSHVDTLFSGCLDAGAPMIRALLSRSFIDLNREPFEFDARMFRERLPAFINAGSPRVASGLGTIPRTVGDGVQIYQGPLDLAEALARVETVYRPYHRALGALLDQAHDATGMALLIDCHSMPSSAVSHMQMAFGKPVDVVLGDRFGSACGPDISALVERELVMAGLTVSRNKPYSGGFFTENHGRPRYNRHALQIEVNRALYMHEASHEPHAGLSELKDLFRRIAQTLAKWLHQEHLPAHQRHAAAAE